MIPSEKLSDIFEQGDELHEILQAYCVDPQRAQDMLAKIIKDKWYSVDISWLLASWNAAKIHIDKKKETTNVLFIEKKTNVLFIIGNKYVFISGTMDVIREDWDIRDFKSSAQGWKPEAVGSKLQWRIYPLIQAIYKNQEAIEGQFLYFVVTKHKKAPRIQLLPAQTTYDTALVLLENLFLDFIAAKDKDEWRTTRGDHCFMCSLKRAGTCPLWAQEKPEPVVEEETRF